MPALAAALLAMPAAASASAPDLLAGATLKSVTANLTIKTLRCAPGVAKSTTACAHLDLTSSFGAPAAPATRRIAGKGRFPSGLRVTGTGRSQCDSETPFAEPVTLPDGSVQYTGSATASKHMALTATDILIASTKRSVSWAWTEPLAPAPACSYFYGSGVAAVPSALPVPGIVTARLPKSSVRRKAFGITIASTRNFVSTEPDGTNVYGDAAWKLKLRYTR